MEKTKKIFEVIRDLIMVGGVFTIISIGISLQNKQTEIIEAQLRLAESLTYDKALTMIESQEKLYKKEISNLTKTQQLKLKECIDLWHKEKELRLFFMFDEQSKNNSKK